MIQFFVSGNKHNQMLLPLFWIAHLYSVIVSMFSTCVPLFKVFANGLEDQGLITGQVIPKTQNMVLDATLLNTQHYKVRIKDEVEQSRE